MTADWADELIESMYRGRRLDDAPPLAETPAAPLRAQRKYVPAWAQQALLDALQEQPRPVGELMARLGRCRNTTRTYLWRMQAAGQVANAHDVWRLAAGDAVPV